MKKFENHQFQSWIGQRSHFLFAERLSWPTLIIEFGRRAKQAQFRVSAAEEAHDFLKGILDVEALYTQFDLNDDFEVLQQQLLNHLWNNQEETQSAREAMRKYPFHATQILAELRHPHIGEDVRTLLTVTTAIDDYFKEFEHIDFSIDSCKPYGIPRITEDHLIGAVWNYAFNEVKYVLEKAPEHLTREKSWGHANEYITREALGFG